MAVLQATTVVSASLGAALVGLLAIAAATPVVAAALVEEPPARIIATPAIALAAFWSGVFAVAAVLVAISSPALGIVGMLAAASELGAAAALWFSRSRRRSRGGGWGGGRDRRRVPRPSGPSGPSVPESYWDHWESQFDHRSAPRRAHLDADDDTFPAR